MKNSFLINIIIFIYSPNTYPTVSIWKIAWYFLDDDLSRTGAFSIITIIIINDQSINTHEWNGVVDNRKENRTDAFFVPMLYNSLVKRVAESIIFAETLTGKFVMISFDKRSLIFFLLKPEMSFAREIHGSVSNIYSALEWIACDVPIKFHHTTKTATTLGNWYRFLGDWLRIYEWNRTYVIRMRCFVSHLIWSNDVARRNLTNYLRYYWLHCSFSIYFGGCGSALSMWCGYTELSNDN